MDWVLGIDVGTNSIGWAAFEAGEQTKPIRLLSGGVRLFDWGRESQNAVSLMKSRGEKRRGRRRLRAARWRRDRLCQVLTRLGAAPSDPGPPEVWRLRARAASEPLSGSDVGRVLLHMARHRGFRGSILRPIEPASDEANEQNRWNDAERDLRFAMAQGGHLTVGELLAKRALEDKAVRARRGEGAAPTRALIAEEFDRIRSVQQAALEWTEEDWATIRDLILEQRPLRPPIAGRCSVFPESDERMPLIRPLAQRFRILQTLCNLRLREEPNAAARMLTTEEFEVLLDILDKGGAHSWASLRRAIGIRTRGAHFTIERERAVGAKKADSREVKGCLAASLLGPVIPSWQDLSLEERDRLVARLLQHRANRRALLEFLSAEPWPEEVRAAIADAVQFELTTERLSLGEKAVSLIVPELKPGVPSHEAFERGVGLHHSDRRPRELLDRLPYYGKLLPGRVSGGTGNPKDDDCKRYGTVNNVTVHIALNELRKVVNALLHRYGRPRRIVIETARELKANTRRLQEIAAEQARRERENKDILKQIAEMPRDRGFQISRRERLLRMRLARRQEYICPYTGIVIGQSDVLSAAYQIDHVIPRRRGGTDAFDNLVLCAESANREKGNQTPYEAWGETPAWHAIEHFLSRIEKRHPGLAWRFAPDAMARIERQADDGDGWLPRQMTDTSYIARTAMEYLGHVAPDVVATRGQLTGYLRAHWDFPKERLDHRHHFVDAAIIAVTDRSIINQLSRYQARRGGLPPPSEAEIEIPYPGFTEEVERCYESIWPSRRPDHSLSGPSGQLHRETPLAQVRQDDGTIRLATRIPVRDLLTSNGAPLADDKLLAALDRFRSQRFRRRFEAEIEKLRAAEPGLGLGRAALKVAEDPQWGPSGIRAISCWFNEKRYEPQAIYTVPRSQGSPAAHRAAIDPNANAWAEIRQDHRGRWKVRVVPKIEAARIAPPDPASDSDLVMLLRSGDLVAWETPGGREVGYLKVMKSNGGLFFWPLRLAANMKAAPLSLNVPIKQRDGIYFSGEGLRKSCARPVTVSVLGRLRDPGPGWAEAFQ